MTGRQTELRRELRSTLSLAIPVVLGELAWMGMGVVDTMMVGRVSAEALGAMSVGRVIFMTIGVFGIGMLLGLDTLVSRAFGAGDPEDYLRSLVQGIHLSLLLAVPLTGAFLAVLLSLGRFGIDPAVLGPAVGYMKAIGWTLLPLLIYTTFRRYLQAINLVRPVMLAMITANLVNVAGNWVLIFGNLGAPALGATGSGWATFIAIVYMCAFLLVAVILHDRESRRGRFGVSFRPDARRLRTLVGLGLPAAVALTLEIGVIALLTVLAGRLEPASLAAHQVALTVASVTFMVPLGISSAGAVRVGQALGREDPAGALRSGWAAILIAGTFMTAAAVVLFAAPRPIVRIFTTTPEVVSVGASLLLLAAAFQLFDGVQVSATGALRGAGDTRTPMLLSLVGYWVVALPVGYGLCFHGGEGVFGLWIGLTAGLILVAVAVVLVWWRRSRNL